MLKRFGTKRSGPTARGSKRSALSLHKPRRAAFEALEPRRVLSAVGLTTVDSVTLPAGSSTFVALNGNDPGQTVNFAVTASDYSKLTPIVMPQTNKSVQFNIHGLGAMTFQLFDNLMALTPAQTAAGYTNSANSIEQMVQQHFYDGLLIYRAGKDGNGNPFVIQGGNFNPNVTNGVFDSTKATTIKAVAPNIKEQVNPDLVFNAPGTLALAHAGPDTSNSEFFVTAEATRSLDYTFTLLGFQTVDQAVGSSTVRQTLQARPTATSGDTQGIGYMTNPVTIDSATVFTDTQNGVLMLKAPSGTAPGDYSITVVASDGTNTPTTRTITVHVVADSAKQVNNPYTSATPSAPVQVQLKSGGTLTNLNNTSGKTLTFTVTGVTAGKDVTILADGNDIGVHHVASSSSVDITTNGLFKLSPGPHMFTAVQTAVSQTATYSSRTEISNVASYSSPATQIMVFDILPAVVLPTDTAHGTDVTVRISGNQIILHDNHANHDLGTPVTFTANSALPITLPDGQSNLVTIQVPSGDNLLLPESIIVQGGAHPTNNKAVVQGTAAGDSFTVTNGSVVDRGLTTTLVGVQQLALSDAGGNDTYRLNSSNIPVAIADTAGNDSLDFSAASAGIAVNLGLDRGQTQAIAAWTNNATLAITGVIENLIGTNFADTLTGGNAATTIIRSGTGNDTLFGGSGNNILIGGGGNNTINGGRNKNLLIGGSGTSWLYGKGTDNVLIGGTTNYDANDQALMSVLNTPTVRSLFGWSIRRLIPVVPKTSSMFTQGLKVTTWGAHDQLIGSGSSNWYIVGPDGTHRRA